MLPFYLHVGFPQLDKTFISGATVFIDISRQGSASHSHFGTSILTLDLWGTQKLCKYSDEIALTSSHKRPMPIYIHKDQPSTVMILSAEVSNPMIDHIYHPHPTLIRSEAKPFVQCQFVCVCIGDGSDSFKVINSHFSYYKVSNLSY